MHPLHLEFTEISSSFSWNLQVEHSPGLYVPVNNLITMTYYGTKNKDLIIKERSLAAKRNYKVSVVTFESVERIEVYYFSTNSPPTIGNCSTMPSFGYTFDVMHYITCRSNWYDEDSDQGLYYLYLYQASRDVNELQVLYFGGESSSPLIPLPVGKVNNSFGSEVRVRVYDIYGDYTETVNKVISEPRLKDSNLTSLTAKQVTALLENFKKELIENNLTMAGRSGDYSKAVQVIESGASIYSNLELPSTDFSLSPDELSAAVFRLNENGQLEALSWNEFWIDYLKPENNAQKEILQKVGENLGNYSAELCGTMVQVRSNLTSYFISQFLTSMAKTISNPDYVTYITLVQSKTLTLQERTFIAMDQLKKLQLIQDMKTKWGLSLMPNIDKICIGLAAALRTLSGTMHSSSVNSDLLTVMSYKVGYNDLPEGVFLNVDGVNFGLKGSSPLDLPNKYVIEFSLFVFEENPYFWDDVGETISSRVLQIYSAWNYTAVPLKNNISVTLGNKNNTPCTYVD
ncbi:hypothetical protein CHS0354_028054 [Potamilus streckersoni]|uniref:PKD/REJ-like domain-containing protein n=1 Tax=Potamilus streckersoni TaxID=2493646 RepID=A0AAE0TIN7_9BIVA|nr:hypothetical protein CHS0354_028054 [Potamilus streckersoni]